MEAQWEHVGTNTLSIVVTDDATKPLTSTNHLTVTVTETVQLRLERQGDEIYLHFATHAGRSYRVVWSEHVPNADELWQTLVEGLSGTGAERTVVERVPADSRARFYRIISTD